MIVTTLAGQSLTLENEPFNNTGSEGRLYNIKGKPDYVAKIFRTAELARKREQKLKAMSRLPAMCSLPPSLTWPVNLLYDGGGAFVGFIMKRLQKSMTLDKLFATNGTAMINQRLAALSSLANTLGRMHMCGVAMGDPGPQNIPVLADCTVQLIDTDSFAINMPDGSQFPCLGCTPEYVAPEMLRAAQGKSYAESGIPFSEWTDCYALAVLIYKALFGGAHPSSYAVAPGAPASTDLPPLAERERNGWVAAFVPRPGLCAPAGVPAYAGHAHAASFLASNIGTGSAGRPSAQVASGNTGGAAANVTAPKLNIAASGGSGASSAPAIGGYVPAMKLVGNTATSKYRRARATSLHGRILTQASRRLRWSAMGRPSSSGRLRHSTVSRKKASSTSTRSLVICSTRDPTRGRASPVRKKPCERVYLIPNRCP